MSSKSETGHARNVGNLKTMTTFLESLGGNYRPSNGEISAEALRLLAASSDAAIRDVNSAEISYTKAVNARKLSFQPLSKLSTRIVNALISSKADQRIIGAAVLLNKKISGRRTTPQKTGEEKETLAAAGKSTREISTSQMSFDLRIENFSKLILLLNETPQYAPNEEDLTIDSLNTLLERLKADNDAVETYASPLANLRIKRNKIMYAENTGIPDIAKTVKAYIKSAFGATSPEYKKISGLKFIRVR